MLTCDYQHLLTMSLSGSPHPDSASLPFPPSDTSLPPASPCLWLSLLPGGCCHYAAVKVHLKPVRSIQASDFHPSCYDSAPSSSPGTVQSHPPFIIQERLTSAWLRGPVAPFLLNHQSAWRVSSSVWAAGCIQYSDGPLLRLSQSCEAAGGSSQVQTCAECQQFIKKEAEQHKEAAKLIHVQ